MAERRDVALLLQFEAHLIDAARGIDREHERKVDRLAMPARVARRRRAEEAEKQQDAAKRVTRDCDLRLARNP